ncbi:MAG TPA: hypothetical protein VMH35_25300 [Streptosporangiaceae bacterium]|nr:hypothetical protein [Streptosporangiaceae bacterium]
MTAAAFDRLLYTDCRAGQGRGAGGGFQVQAQSVNVDSAQAKMAIGWLLYDAPNAWIMQRRPIAEFPLGFAHAAAAGYGTAQSRYVGTEATGARQGNHLADCLLTRDMDLYGPTRPAQLWGSPLWRAEAWDSRECPQLEEPPPPGPLTVDAVADWVRASPERATVLTRMVSLLEDPTGPRVVITAAAVDTAMHWIAAATLLLPIRAALNVSFKVFCANPLQASHRVVAVMKELNPQLVPGRDDSVFVLDAEEGVSDPAEISERARFWVARLTEPGDPYDVVDAVELAEQLGAGAGPPLAALITAWALTNPGSQLDDPGTLFRWLAHADPKQQQEHGPAVVQRILTAGPTADMLRWIDRAGALGRIGIDRPGVRARLLTAEIGEVRAGLAPPGELLGRVPADTEARRDADSELSSAIVLGSDAQDDLLLRLSRRHLIEPQLGPLRDRLLAFAIGWVDHPARGYRPDGWALREEILDLTYDELHERLNRAGLAQVMPALRALWRHFAHRPGDPGDPLYCQIKAAAMRTMPSQQRPGRLSVLIQQARQTGEPGAALAQLQRALVEWQCLGAAEALLLLRELPESARLAPEAVRISIAEIDRLAGRPTALVLDALDMLDRRRLLPADKRYAYLRTEDRAVLGFIQATTTAQFHSDTSLSGAWMEELGRVDPAVTAARLGALLRACLDLPTPGLGAGVLGVLPDQLPWLFIDRWNRELGGARPVRAAVEGVCWHEEARLPGNLKSRIAAALNRHGSNLGPAEQEEWFYAVRSELRPEDVKAWSRLAGYEAATRHRGFRGRKDPG